MKKMLAVLKNHWFKVLIVVWMCWATYALLDVQKVCSYGSWQPSTDIESDISNIKSDMSDITSDVSSIKTMVGEVESDVSGIKTTLHDGIESRIIGIDSSVTSIKSTVEDIESSRR